ncbi:MAG: hypothetical protein ABIU05_14905 [Nitrospirales bacterium]
MNDDLDIEAVLHALDGLLQSRNAEIDKMREDIAIIVSLARQKPIRPYGELDDLAASLAFSTLPSTD